MTAARRLLPQFWPPTLACASIGMAQSRCRERFSTPYFQAAATASRRVLIDLDQMPDRSFGRRLRSSGGDHGPELIHPPAETSQEEVTIPRSPSSLPRHGS
jgi:hypothetical protein